MIGTTERSAAGAQSADLKIIHIGRSALRLSEDEYRAIVHGVSGGRTTSSKGLTAPERQRVIERMKALGFKLTPKKKTGDAAVAMIRQAQLRKLRAMWYALADVGAVERPATVDACNAAVEAWAIKRLPELQALRFATGHDMGDLIEQMKAWGERVGANVFDGLPSAAETDQGH